MYSNKYCTFALCTIFLPYFFIPVITVIRQYANVAYLYDIVLRFFDGYNPSVKLVLFYLQSSVLSITFAFFFLLAFLVLYYVIFSETSTLYRIIFHYYLLICDKFMKNFSYRLDRNRNGGEILVYVREDITSKMLTKHKFADTLLKHYLLKLLFESANGYFVGYNISILSLINTFLIIQIRLQMYISFMRKS